MAHTKLSTRKSPKQEKSSDQQQLSEQLASILKNPAIPEIIYNGIVDGLAELQSGKDSDSPEAILAAIAVAKGRATEPKAAEQGQSEPAQVSDDEPDLRLTMDQYKDLQRFWWAVGQFSELLAETPGAPDDVLGIIADSVGSVFEDLDQQQRRAERKGGAA